MTRSKRRHALTHRHSFTYPQTYTLKRCPSSLILALKTAYCAFVLWFKYALILYRVKTFHPEFYRSMDIGVNIRVEETLEEKVVAQIMAIHRHDSYGIYPKTFQSIPPHDSGANNCKLAVRSFFLQRRGRAPFFWVLTLRHWVSGFRRFHERCRIHL